MNSKNQSRRTVRPYGNKPSLAGRHEADGPGAMMKRAHLEKLRLCDMLEKAADALPRVNRLECLGVANAIVPLLRDVHKLEETVVFPFYEAALSEGEAMFATTRRLRAEHVEDECFAAEVTETLLAMGHGGRIGNVEAVGFMFRGFFESLRRHIAFEREHVLPKIGLTGVLDWNGHAGRGSILVSPRSGVRDG